MHQLAAQFFYHPSPTVLSSPCRASASPTHAAKMVRTAYTFAAAAAAVVVAAAVVAAAAESAYSDAAPAAKPYEPPVCIKYKNPCGEDGDGECCEDLTCTPNDFGATCEKKCLVAGKTCGSTYEKCCEGMMCGGGKCVAEGYKMEERKEEVKKMNKDAYKAEVKATAAPVYTKAKPVYTEAKKAYTEAPKYDDNKCWAGYERCAGAPGKPYVHYGKGCCNSGDSCQTADWLGYGKWCLKRAPEFYNIGERCVGAVGKEYVPYAPCKDGYCVESPDLGYGKFCVKEMVKKKYATEAPKYTAPPKMDYNKEDVKATAAPKYTEPPKMDYKKDENVADVKPVYTEPPKVAYTHPPKKEYEPEYKPKEYYPSPKST